MSNPLHFEVTLSTTDNQKAVEEAKQMVLKIKPQWSTGERLEWEFFSGGITNKIMSVWNRDDQNANDRVLFRIYGEKTELFIDRQGEKRNMQLLSRYGYAEPLYGTFQNGLIYGFFPGHVLTTVEDVSNPKLADLIAKQMAKFHTVGLLQPENGSKISDDELGSREPILLPKLKLFIENIPDKFDDAAKQAKFSSSFPQKAELLAELEAIRQKVNTMNSQVVFCHNDLLPRNMIYNAEKKVVQFIDYEYSAFSYEAFDIGNHFCEYAGVENVDYSLFPGEKYQKSWLHKYLTYWREFTKGSPPDDQDVQTLYIQTNVFATIAHFFWATWAIVQARYSTINFDYLQYGIIRMNEYKKSKSKTWNIGQ